MKIVVTHAKAAACPLCGDEAFLHEDQPRYGDSVCWVKCNNLQCGCTINSHKDRATALALWNRRG